ncbi:MAG: FGGY-family carbohydrate kinase [Chloroflexota bacterium]
MSRKYLMGIDVGTQSAKVVIFDLEGNIICDSRQPLRKMVIPAPLLAEHPDDDIWDALKIALKATMERFQTEIQGDANAILAVGLCGIRCCRVLLKANGELAYPVISWMDKRLNVPYEQIDAYGDVHYVTTTSGYLTHRLTGEFKDTCANYIGWWPMDDNVFNWSDDPSLYETCNLTQEQLFDVIKPGEILGHITPQVAKMTNLPEGLPVVATAHDKAVEALGTSTLDAGTVLISLGTYIGAMVHGRENVQDAQHFWSFQASVPNRYLYECMGVRRGMWTISWFCEQFGDNVLLEAKKLGVSIETLFEREAVSVPAGCEGLLTIHDWAPPVEAEFRKGVMFGFDSRHTRAHIYRSILEGIAFTMKNHVDKMIEELNMPLERLVLSGGGANSDLFLQIFADVFGVPVQRSQMKSSASIGCAINAGIAVGAFDSYEEAIGKMVHSGDEVAPRLENHKLYSELNKKVYQLAHTHFDPILKSLSKIVD